MKRKFLLLILTIITAFCLFAGVAACDNDSGSDVTSSNSSSESGSPDSTGSGSSSSGSSSSDSTSSGSSSSDSTSSDSTSSGSSSSDSTSSDSTSSGSSSSDSTSSDSTSSDSSSTDSSSTDSSGGGSGDEPTVDPTTYTVTLAVSYSGSGTAGSVAYGTEATDNKYEENSTLTITATANNGYEFVGWYTDLEQDAVSTNASYEITVTADVTYTALFKATQYNVIFKAGDTEVSTVTYTVEDTAVTEPAVPEKTGYTGAWESYNLTYGADVTVNAVYTANDCTVTYIYYNGNESTTATAKYDGTVTKPADPTKTGYTFNGWYTDESCTESYDFTAAVTGDITLYAGWTATTYSITYNSSISADNGNPTSYTIESETITLANLTADGYTFNGWYTSNTFEENTKVTEIAKGSYGDITLYASWTAVATETDTVTLALSNSNAGSVTGGGSYAKNTQITISATANNGYTFTGWYSGDSLVSENASYTFTVTENVTLTATYTAITYYVYLYNGETLTSTLTYTVESSDVTLSDLEVTGYTFNGWFTTSTFDTDTQVTSVATSTCADVTLYAKLTINSYAVTFVNNNGTENTEKTVEYNGTVTADTITYTGYTFIGWYTDEDCTDGNAYDFETAVTANITLYAKWEAITYTVTYVYSDGTTSNTTATVAYGNAATAPEDPAYTGYTFLGWYLDGAESAYDFTTVLTGDITLTAKWEAITYTVTYNYNDSTTTSTTATVNYGGTATKPADPTKTGYTFNGWYLDGAESAYDFTTVLTGNITLVAQWTAIQYKVIFVADSATVETVTYTVEDQSITAPAVPDKTGYTGAWANYSLTYGEDVTVNAVYTIITYTVTFSNDGSTSTATYTVESTTITLPSAGTIDGYTFGGWYTEADGAGTLFADATTSTVTLTDTTGDFTVYAYWYVTVTYVYATTDSGEIYTTTAQLAKGVGLTAPELTTYTDNNNVAYSFVSWCTDNTLANTYSFGSALTSDTTIYARFAQQIVLKNGIYYQYYGTNASSTFGYSNSFGTNYSDVIPSDFYAVSGYDSDTLSAYYAADSNYWLVIESEIDGFEVFATWSTVFSGLTTIVNVVLPSTLKYIDTKAFNSCTNLKNVIILADIVYLANGGTGSNYPFYGCSSTLNIYYNRVYSLGESTVADNDLGFSYTKSSNTYIRVNISTSWTWVNGIEALVSVSGALDSFDDSAIRDAVNDALEAYFAANGITYNQFATSWTDGYLFISTVLTSDTAESSIKTYVESGIDEAYASTALGLYGATATIASGKITVAITANENAYYKTEVTNSITNGGTFALSEYTNNEDGSAAVTYTDGTTTVKATITNAKVYSYTPTDSNTVTALYVLSGASVTVTANVSGVTLSSVTYGENAATGDQTNGFTFTAGASGYTITLGWTAVTMSEYTVTVYSDISYSLDGADIASGTQTIDLGDENATLDGKTVATTEDYYFLGWAYSNESTLTFTSNITYSTEVTYYAIWGYNANVTLTSYSATSGSTSLPTSDVIKISSGSYNAVEWFTDSSFTNTASALTANGDNWYTVYYLRFTLSLELAYSGSSSTVYLNGSALSSTYTSYSLPYTIYDGYYIEVSYDSTSHSYGISSTYYSTITTVAIYTDATKTTYVGGDSVYFYKSNGHRRLTPSAYVGNWSYTSTDQINADNYSSSTTTTTANQNLSITYTF